MSVARHRFFGYALQGFFFALLFFCFTPAAEANFREYSVTLSNSAPATTSNQTVQFKTTAAIQPGDYIRVRPESGEFTIPTSTSFSVSNVDLYVNTGSGYVRRNTGTTTDASTDGVSITTGTSGDVTVTLNSTTGIPANAYVRLLLGNHTLNATSTDLGIINPSSTTTHAIYLEKGGSNDVSVRPLVAIIDPITFGPVDTTETEPPLRFNGAPTGTLSGTTLNVEVSLNTNEFADCRYAQTAGVDFASMAAVFTVTGSIVHSIQLAVASSTTYNLYVRCIDDEGNFNTDDYLITFVVDDPPTGNPGNTGTSTQGSDNGSGSGTGSTGSGSGSGGGNTGGSSGGGGGGGGGGSGGSSGNEGAGGFESSDDAYPSGDARVIINGYAFPNRTVVALVDGTIAETGTADSNGKFVITIDAIARGTYSFGVYAVDANSVKSSTFSTTFNVIGGKTSSLSNVNVMPSILVKPDPVDPGEQLTVSGYTLPNATVTIENENEATAASRKSYTTTSGSNGAWSINIDTNGFTTGTYKVRARAAQTNGVSTGFSDYTFYGVGQAATVLNADLNRDGKVNLTDFSILLFWWGSDGGNSNPPADINRDGNVSLTDFSILLFQWTG